MRALVGMGGNLGQVHEVVARFAAAIATLRLRLPIARVRASELYLSEPVGPIAEQPRFVNAVVELEFANPIAPVALMAELLGVELAFGRVRSESAPMGPRTLDLDLLFVDREVLATDGPPALSLPHPGVAERAFVLAPLADIMGRSWHMPGIERSVDQCLGAAHVAAQRIECMRSLPSAWLGD